MTWRSARLTLLLACIAAAAAAGDAAGGGGDVDTPAADDSARSSLQAVTPEWLAARSQKQFRINGDTWHRIAAAAGDAASVDEAPRDEARQRASGAPARYYYYNERTRATAWQLPRHRPRGTPLWALKAGGEARLGPPLLDLSALSFPDCASDWVTILLPAAMFAAAKHAGAAWRAMKGAARDAVHAAALLRPLRGPSGAASKAD